MGIVDVGFAKPAVTLPPGSRLGLPGAIIFVVGAAMIYVALRGWDAKYAIAGGRIAGGGPRPDAPAEPGTKTGGIPGGVIA